MTALPGLSGLRFALHEDTLPADAVRVVDEGLDRANEAAAPLHEVRALACFAHDDDGRVVGGAIGRRWGTRCELHQLWVDPARRRLGIGAQLVRRFEAAATARGCTLCHLDSFSFQAPRLYRALGYVVVHGTPFPHGIVKYTLQRPLSVPAPQAAPLDWPPVRVQQVLAADAQLAATLAELLADAVAGGASVGFVLPLAPGQTQRWAGEVLADLGPGLALWVARVDGRIVGTVQLGPCLKPNGRHRGEVMKLLVHRSARGLGVARALMAALEAHARASGLSLLVLDTEAGSQAEAVYRHLGWWPYGQVPDFALSPGGELRATACYYKRLA